MNRANDKEKPCLSVKPKSKLLVLYQLRCCCTQHVYLIISVEVVASRRGNKDAYEMLDEDLLQDDDTEQLLLLQQQADEDALMEDLLSTTPTPIDTTRMQVVNEVTPYGCYQDLLKNSEQACLKSLVELLQEDASSASIPTDTSSPVASFSMDMSLCAMAPRLDALRGFAGDTISPSSMINTLNKEVITDTTGLLNVSTASVNKTGGESVSIHQVSSDDDIVSNTPGLPINLASWTLRFEELLEFRAECGHVNVPHDYPPIKTRAKIWRLRPRGRMKNIRQTSPWHSG